MRLRELGEFGFIDLISRMTTCGNADVVVGPGDDAAVVRTAVSERLAVTTDAMLEGRHFRLDWLTPYQVGARAMTAALSDLAAMGASPRFAFTSLALPVDWEVEQATALARGLAEQAARHGACVLGGDTIAAHEHALVDVAAIGVCGRHVWQRSGAQPGEVVVVTGDLGGCAAAIAAKAAGHSDIACWPRYAAPVPRVAVARRLEPLGLVTACLDISDGLVQDARHICERSGVGIRIDATRVPLAPETVQTAKAVGLDPLLLALSSSEEFELLLTVPAEAVERLREASGASLTVIGEVVKGTSVQVFGAEGPLEMARGGWDHFTDNSRC